MAQKLRPMKRSLVTHQRIITMSDKMNEFIDNLFMGKLDEDIDKMMSDIPEEVLKNYPPIDSLVSEMEGLVTGELEKDLTALNRYLNAHDSHPQSLRLLHAIARGLNGKLSQEAIDTFKEGIFMNISKKKK